MHVVVIRAACIFLWDLSPCSFRHLANQRRGLPRDRRETGGEHLSRVCNRHGGVFVLSRYSLFGCRLRICHLPFCLLTDAKGAGNLDVVALCCFRDEVVEGSLGDEVLRSAARFRE